MEEEGRIKEIEGETEGVEKKKRKKYLHIAIFFAVFFIAVYIFLQPAVKKGDPAPDFQLTDLNGEMVSLSRFRGKVVFLNFWATWCPPCIEEIPSINELNRKIKRDDFVILAVNIDQTGRDDIKKFVHAKGMEFTVLLDPKSDVAAGKYGITGVPETFIIGRDGKIIERYIGPRNWISNEFINFFNTILNSEKS